MLAGMTDHYSHALTHLSDVEAARDHLSDLYKMPAVDRDARVVASLHADLGHAMKLAEIHATLDVAQQLRDMTSVLDRGMVR